MRRHQCRITATTRTRLHAPIRQPARDPVPSCSGDFVTTEIRPTAASSRPRPPVLARIASWSFMHRGRAIAAWLLLLIAVTGVGRAAGSAFRDDFSGGNPQSQQAQSLLAQKFPADAGDRAQIVFQAPEALKDSAAPRIEALLQAV